MRRLPLGHLEASECGMIVIENLTGKHLSVNPTQQEKILLEKRIVEVRTTVPDTNPWLIRPGCFFFAESSIVDGILLSCPIEDTVCKVHLFPR